MVGSRLRTRLTVEIWCYVWAVSCCYLALQEYLLREYVWRIHVLASAVPYAMLAVGYALFLPESPYFHLQRGQWAEARKMARLLIGNADRRRLVHWHGSSSIGPARAPPPMTNRSKRRLPQELTLAHELTSSHQGAAALSGGGSVAPPEQQQAPQPLSQQLEGPIGAAQEPMAAMCGERRRVAPSEETGHELAGQGLVPPEAKAKPSHSTSHATAERPAWWRACRPSVLELFTTWRSARATLIQALNEGQSAPCTNLELCYPCCDSRIRRPLHAHARTRTHAHTHLTHARTHAHAYAHARIRTHVDRFISGRPYRSPTMQSATTRATSLIRCTSSCIQSSIRNPLIDPIILTSPDLT